MPGASGSKREHARSKREHVGSKREHTGALQPLPLDWEQAGACVRSKRELCNRYHLIKDDRMSSNTDDGKTGEDGRREDGKTGRREDGEDGEDEHLLGLA